MVLHDIEIRLGTRSGTTPVRITATALTVVWGKGIGPQDSYGVHAANQELFDEIAVDKLDAGDLVDGGVVIDGVDVEG